MEISVFMLVSITYIASSVNSEPITFVFVGDIAFSGPVRYYVENGYYSYNDSFKDVAKYIREADVSVANLESPFVDHESYRNFNGKKAFVLDASADAASSLSFAGFDAITLANNHLNDFGPISSNYTVNILKRIGLKYTGVSYGKFDASQVLIYVVFLGIVLMVSLYNCQSHDCMIAFKPREKCRSTLETSGFTPKFFHREPLIMEVKGRKVGFLGYCDSPTYPNQNWTELRMKYDVGPAVYSDNIATRDINKLKAKVDIIVVLMHFGEQLYRRPVRHQRRVSKHLMSLGVQMVIGAHPHVLQPHCLDDNKIVAYSLGNFLFYPKQPPSGILPSLFLNRVCTEGRLGVKSDQNLIDAFEHFVLEDCEDIKMSRMLKATLSRNGVLHAEYLPLKIAFDPNTKRLYPKPVKNAKWINVCGKEDKQCEKC
ncbi:unnamed protein product [Porites evermanni]|uniref:Capsule synthesis protein CapA domain-containing protein n=1 Tax=Porites evermanni TaxID=104178 RepID=A0ABN8MQH5_9CNID|nr:unnamed protein product [Porites evermanni]